MKKVASKKKGGAKKKLARRSHSVPRVKAPAKLSAKTKPRADLGAPIDGFFEKHPAKLRSILDALRSLVEDVAPHAESSLKWGMPFFTLSGNVFCAFGAHKTHVNLILPGAPGTFADPQGLLVGEGKTGQRLVIKSVDELPRDVVRRWLRTAVDRAQS